MLINFNVIVFRPKENKLLPFFIKLNRKFVLEIFERIRS